MYVFSCDSECQRHTRSNEADRSLCRLRRRKSPPPPRCLQSRRRKPVAHQETRTAKVKPKEKRTESGSGARSNETHRRIFGAHFWKVDMWFRVIWCLRWCSAHSCPAGADARRTSRGHLLHQQRHPSSLDRNDPLALQGPDQPVEIDTCLASWPTINDSYRTTSCFTKDFTRQKPGLSHPVNGQLLWSLHDFTVQKVLEVQGHSFSHQLGPPHPAHGSPHVAFLSTVVRCTSAWGRSHSI